MGKIERIQLTDEIALGIRDRRERSNISRRQLSLAIGINERTLQSIEHQEQDTISNPNIKAINAYLKDIEFKKLTGIIN